MKLYEITNEIRAIVNDGELTEGAEQRLDALEMELAAKVDNCMALIREMYAEAYGIDNEATRLRELATKRWTAIKRLEDYVLHCLQSAGLTGVNLANGERVKVQKASRPSIRWDGDPDAIPDGFRREPKVQLDGVAAYAAYKAGSLPDGFAVQFSHSLRSA